MARPLDAVAAELEQCGAAAPALLVGTLAEALETEEAIIAALAGDLMGSETLTHGLLVLTPQRVLDHLQVSRGPMLGGGTSLHCTVIPLHDVVGVRSITQSDGYQVLVSVWGRTPDLHIDEAFDADAGAREAWARRAAAFVSAVQARIPAEAAQPAERPSAPAQAPRWLLAVVAGPLA